MLKQVLYNRFVRTTIKWAVFLTLGSLFWLLFIAMYAVLAPFM